MNIMVEISNARFEELIRNERTLELIMAVLRNAPAYRVEETLKMVLKEEDNDAE